MVARHTRPQKRGHVPSWRVYRRQKVAADVLAVLRLDALNREISDCVLIPSSAMTKRYLRLAGAASFPPRAVHVETISEMLKARIGKGKVAARRRH